MAFITTQLRPSTSAPGDGSRTATITDAAPRPENHESSNKPDSTVGALRLRGAPRHRQRVAWDDDVVDNEGCGRKSSKICCIYHKPRPYDESSSDDSSDSDSDSSCDHKRRSQHSHAHDHRASEDGVRSQMKPAQQPAVHELEDDAERNVYETIPVSKKGKRQAVLP